MFNWPAVILGSAITFAALGLVFKASVATIVGQLIAWSYDRLLQRDPTDGLPWWVQLLFYAGLAILAWKFF